MFTIILNHFHLKMNPIALKQILLLENIWIHTFSILDIDLQPPLRNIHPSKVLFPPRKSTLEGWIFRRDGCRSMSNIEIMRQQETSSIQTYRRTINPIILQIPNKEVFYAFPNRVKEYCNGCLPLSCVEA